MPVVELELGEDNRRLVNAGSSEAGAKGDACQQFGDHGKGERLTKMTGVFRVEITSVM